MIVRPAVSADLMPIYDLLRPFYDEGHWSTLGTFSPENTVAYIAAFMAHADVFIADDGVIKGIIVLEAAHEFHTQPVAYISNFYVSPLARGTRAARMLFEAAMKQADDYGCIATFAANSGINALRANNLFDNICMKFGFRKFSNLNVRGLHGLR